MWVLDRVHSLLDRHPAAGDAGLALVVVALCVSTLPGTASGASIADVVLTVALAAPLVLRRRAPVAMFAAIMLLCAAEPALTDTFLAANVAALIAVYSLVGYAPRPVAAAGVAVALAGTVPFALHFDELRSAGWGLACAVMAVHVGLAAVLGDRMRAERARRAATAAADERARIARELHDVVAHSLAVVIAQADGGRYAAPRDPQAAIDALTTIARSAREAQGQMRHALGLLDRAGAAARRPQPGVGELPALVERTREAGLPIAYAEHGPPRPVAPATGMTVYRIAQEALTNVLKHAGPGVAATVELRWEPAAVSVLVRDDGASEGRPGDDRPGRGLAGMRERVEPRGGTLRAGPRAGGGFEVQARLPA